MKNLSTDLAELFLHYRSVLPSEYRWEDEGDRWDELVYMMFSHLVSNSETDCREIVSGLGKLGLLEIEILSGASSPAGVIDWNNGHAKRLNEILLLNHVPADEAQIVISTVCAAAAGIHAKYGKLQVLLRKHGEAMLRDLRETMKMDGNPVSHQIVTSWLQSVFEMPIPMSNRWVDEFCRKNECTVDDLVKSADEINVNVCVVDDIIKLHSLDFTEEKT